MKPAVDYADNFSGQTLQKFFIEGHETGNFTILCRHKIRRRQDILVHGVIISGQCYTHPLLLPDLPIDHHMANIYNSSALAIATDPVFARECMVDHVKAIACYHQTAFAVLEHQLASMPDSELKKAMKKVPFRQHIIDATPIHALRVKTEKILWHQRLGHPRDEFLYNAHKTVDGVPKFASQNSVLDQSNPTILPCYQC